MQLGELGGGVGAERVGQPLPGAFEHLERAPGPAGRGQRTHQQRGERLVQRVRGDQLLELGDELGTPAAPQVGRDPVLLRRQPLLLEPDRGGAGDVRKFEGTAPKREGVLHGGRVHGQAGEPVGVHPVRIDGQPVPRGYGLDDQVGRGPAQAGDEGLERVAGGGGRVVSPDAVDQPVRGHHPVRVRRRAPATGTVSPVPARSSNGPSTAMSTRSILPCLANEPSARIGPGTKSFVKVTSVRPATRRFLGASDPRNWTDSVPRNSRQPLD